MVIADYTTCSNHRSLCVAHANQLKDHLCYQDKLKNYIHNRTWIVLHPLSHLTNLKNDDIIKSKPCTEWCMKLKTIKVCSNK